MTRMLSKPLFKSMHGWPNLWDDDFSLLETHGSQGLDVYETDTTIVVKANVAGVDADDIDVTFEKDVLTIRAEASQKEEDKDTSYFSKSSWNYSYRVAIPGNLDADEEPKVELADGILHVTFKKSATAQPKKLRVTKR